MASITAKIPALVAADITFCNDKVYSISHFVRLCQKLLRHRVRRRRLKAGLPPVSLSTLTNRVNEELLELLLNAWNSVANGGIRVGRKNKYRHTSLGNVLASARPESSGFYATARELTQALTAYFQKFQNHEAQILQAGRAILRKHQRLVGGQKAHSKLLSSASSDGNSALIKWPGKAKTRPKLVFNLKAHKKRLQRALEQIHGYTAVGMQHAATPRAREPAMYLHSSTIWQTLTGHEKNFQKLPRFEWQALLGIASTGKAGILQPDLVRLVGQDKRSLPKRTSQLALKGHIVKRSVLKRGSKTSQMWLTRFAPPLFESGPVDVSRPALASGTECVSWHRRWSGETIDYLALGQTAIAIVKAYGVMKHLDLKKKLGVFGIRWHMRVLARTLRYWAACGVIRYVAASLNGTIYKDCIKFIRHPYEHEWTKYLSTGGAPKMPPKDRIAPDVILARARKAAQRRKRKLEGTDKALQLWPRWKYPSRAMWTPERNYVNLLCRAIVGTGAAGATNRMLARTVVCRDFVRFTSRMGLALTGVDAPKHLRHLGLVHVKSRSGKILEYRYYHNNVAPLATQETNDDAQADGASDFARTVTRYRPNLFYKHSKELGNSFPRTLSELASLCDEEPKSKKEVKRGRASKSRHTAAKLAAPALNPSESVPIEASNHDTTQPQPTEASPQVFHPEDSAPSVLVPAGAAGSRVMQPAPSSTTSFQAAPVRAVVPSPLTGEELALSNHNTTAGLASTILRSPTRTKTPQSQGVKRKVPEKNNQEEPTAKKPRLENVYVQEKRDDGPKKKGRPKLSLVVVFNLKTFTIAIHEQDLEFVKAYNLLVSSHQDDASKLTAKDHNSIGEEPDDVRAVEADPGGEEHASHTAVTPGQEKKRSKKAINVWKCEKCGKTWRNDNGLSYHLTKSRTPCNPNFDPDTPKTSRVRCKSRASAAVDIDPLAEDEAVAEQSPAKRPVRKARSMAVQKLAESAITEIDNDDDEARRTSRSPHSQSQVPTAETPVQKVRPGPKPKSKSKLQPGVGLESTLATPWFKRKKIRDPELPDIGAPAAGSLVQEVPQFPQDFGMIDMGQDICLSSKDFGCYNDGLDDSTPDHGTEPHHVRETKRVKATLSTFHGKAKARRKSSIARLPAPAIKSIEHAETAGEMGDCQSTVAYTAEELEAVLPIGGGSDFKISGIVMRGPGTITRNGTSEVRIPGESEDFTPTTFRADDHMEDFALVNRKPIHYWILTILDYLCRQNGGVFPGSKSAYLAMIVIWHEHLDHLVSVPQPQTLSRALEEQSGSDMPEVCRFRYQIIHAQRGPVTFELLHLPGSDPKGPIATLMKQRVVAAYPAIYIPMAFVPALDVLCKIGVHFEKSRAREDTGRGSRKLAPVLEELNAPAYLNEISKNTPPSRAARIRKLQKPPKQLKVPKVQDFPATKGRPRDRSWQYARSAASFLQNMENSAWNGTPLPVAIQKWPNTLIRKTAKSHRRANPGLETLPLSFWQGLTVDPSKVAECPQTDLPHALRDILRRGNKHVSFAGIKPSSQKQFQIFSGIVNAIHDWEISVEGKDELLNSWTVPGTVFVNLHLAADTRLPEQENSIVWKEENQALMHTLKYAQYHAMEQAEEAKERHRAAKVPDEKFTRRRVATSKVLDGKVLMVSQVVAEENRQCLTSLPQSREDFSPQQGFFGMRTGPNASLTSFEQRLLISAFVCVSSLAGGISHTVDYGIMLRTFPEFTPSALTKFWINARKERGPYVKKLRQAFEREFPSAYASKRLPQLDFQNLTQYNWKKLVLWTAKLELDREYGRLPNNIDAMLETHNAVATKSRDSDWRDGLYARLASTTSRMRSLSVHVFNTPCEPTPVMDSYIDIGRARSYIKSLCCVPVTAKYTPQAIAQRLVDMSPDKKRKTANKLLQKAAQALNLQRVVIKGRARRDLVAGSFRLHGLFMKQLNRWCKIDRFEQAVQFKAELDTAFRRGERVMVRYDAGEGVVMAILNLLAHERLYLDDDGDVPHVPLGFKSGCHESLRSNNNSNSNDKLHWRVFMRPTDRWIYDEDMHQRHNPLLTHVPRVGSYGEVPMWCSIFGELDVDVWLKALAHFTFSLATKGPAAGVADMCMLSRPYLERFEVQLLLDWVTSTGVAYTLRGDHTARSRSPTYTTAEWWWWVVGTTKIMLCGDRQLVEPHTLKVASTYTTRAADAITTLSHLDEGASEEGVSGGEGAQESRRLPLSRRPLQRRRRFATLAVRFAAQNKVLTEKVQKKRAREKERRQAMYQAELEAEAKAAAAAVATDPITHNDNSADAGNIDTGTGSYVGDHTVVDVVDDCAVADGGEPEAPAQLVAAPPEQTTPDRSTLARSRVKKRKEPLPERPLNREYKRILHK